jgi:hypothetical protein
MDQNDREVKRNKSPNSEYTPLLLILCVPPIRLDTGLNSPWYTLDQGLEERVRECVLCCRQSFLHILTVLLCLSRRVYYVRKHLVGK